MPRETIILDLQTGDGQGLRMAKFPHSWTGQAFAAPRTELKELLAKPELDTPGIYILIGVETKTEIEVEEDTGLQSESDVQIPVAYIGVGKSIRNRLKNRNEEYWNQAFVFVGTNGSLHEGHVKFLEGRIIDEAREIGRFKIINDQPSGSPLPDYEAAAMEGFLDKIKILLPVLGCNLLIPKAQAEKKKPLICKIKGLVAYGNRSKDGFVVFKGSEAVLTPRKHAEAARDWTFLQREKLKNLKVLVPEGDHLRFASDYEFSSPSAAAAAVRGGTASGQTEWRTKEGITLKDLEAATIKELD